MKDVPQQIMVERTKTKLKHCFEILRNPVITPKQLWSLPDFFVHKNTDYSYHIDKKDRTKQKLAQIQEITYKIFPIQIFATMS